MGTNFYNINIISRETNEIIENFPQAISWDEFHVIAQISEGVQQTRWCSPDEFCALHKDEPDIDEAIKKIVSVISDELHVDVDEDELLEFLGFEEIETVQEIEQSGEVDWDSRESIVTDE
jgi:hypothetical protein